MIIFIQQEIRTGIGIQSDHFGYLLCIFTHLRRNFFWQICRTGLYRTACFVFILVIVEALNRRNLNNWKCLSFNHTNREFTSLDIFLNDQLIFPVKRFIECFLKLCCISDNRHTDTGPSAAWLYDARKCQRKLCHIILTVLFFHGNASRCRNSRTCKQLFCHTFIHGNRAAQIITSGIFYTKQIKSCLQLSVLSVFSVQCHKHDICHLAHTDYIRSEKAWGLILSGSFYGCQIRCYLRDVIYFYADFIRTVKNSVQIFLFITVTHEHIQQDHPVSIFF